MPTQTNSHPIDSSVGMTMHEATEITVRIGTVPNHRQIELVFTFPPTQQQVIEATRHVLTDEEIVDELALCFMQAVKEIPLPQRHNFSKGEINGKVVSVWNLPLLFFKPIIK